MKNNPNYYKNLTINYPKEVPSPAEEQIILDLRRTFPEDEYFNKPETLSKLKNILLAFSRRNSSLGYTQGFNFIAGRILKIIENEEETFWIFTQIIEQHLPINYYNDSLGVMVDCSIVHNFIDTYNSKLKPILIEKGLQMLLSSVVFKWMISLFIQNTPENLFLTIWDIFLLEGNIILFKAAVGLIQIISKEIMKMKKNSYEDATNILSMKSDESNCRKTLIYYLFIKRFFDFSTIKELRKDLYPKMFEGIKKFRTPSSKVEKAIKDNLCDIGWPFCIKNVCKLKMREVCVYKQINYPNVESDYFTFRKKKNRWRNCSFEEKKNEDDDLCIDNKKINQFKEVVIERQRHLCGKKAVESTLGTNNRSKSTAQFFVQFKFDYGFEERNIKRKTIKKSVSHGLKEGFSLASMFGL